MCSARRLMVFNVCVKFHENMSSRKTRVMVHVFCMSSHGVNIMVFNVCVKFHENMSSSQTRVVVHVFCMSSHGVNICVKFHENMSSGFKVMEKTQKLLTHKGQ